MLLLVLKVIVSVFLIMVCIEAIRVALGGAVDTTSGLLKSLTSKTKETLEEEKRVEKEKRDRENETYRKSMLRCKHNYDIHPWDK